MGSRILILGCAGSGKTTLSRTLSAAHNLPLVHLDHLFWAPGWVQRDNATFDALLHKELSQDRWIIEGNYTRTIPQRLARADTVIFLDISPWVCAFRVLMRWLLDKSDQAPGCRQKVDGPFLKYVLWDYPRDNRAKTLAIMQRDNPDRAWIWLKSTAEIAEFTQTLAQNSGTTLEKSK